MNIFQVIVYPDECDIESDEIMPLIYTPNPCFASLKGAMDFSWKDANEVRGDLEGAEPLILEWHMPRVDDERPCWWTKDPHTGLNYEIAVLDLGA